ncbi:endolytic transglycosylase MltG [soil metagenome]
MTVQGRGRLPRNGSDGRRSARAYGVDPSGTRNGSYRPPRRGGTWTGVLLIGVLAAIVLGGAFLFAGPALRGFARDMVEDNPQAMRFGLFGDIIREELGDDLEAPASSDATPVEFVVAEGTTVSRIGRDLVEQGLLSNQLAFQYLVITRDVESDLQTGTFTLTATMTPEDIVERLQLPPDPPPARITIALREGLRIEQVVAQLQDSLPAEIDPAEFYALVSQPSDELRSEYEWMSVIPAGRSLEGFLGSGVFEMDADTSADGFVRILLDDWERSIGDIYIPEATDADRDFYEIMTLASIVEKEAVLDEERARIAGVYQNRLDGKLNGNRLINADPTVIYANDTVQLRAMDLEEWPGYAFWGLIGVASLNDFAVPEELQGYQTYQTQGLPPGPISSPTARTVEAALNPETETDLLFFVACGEGTHRFATSLDEHNTNVAECRG